DKDIYNVKLNAKMNILVKNKESNLVPSIIASNAFSMLDGKEAFEFQSNPKAPLGLTYLLKIKNNPFNPQDTQVIHPGTEFRVSSMKQFHIVVKLPNGREHLVYKRFSDDEYVLNQPFDVQNDIAYLFADYQGGSGLSNGVTQATIDEIRIRVENIKDESLKKELQKKVNEAQMLLNLKPNYTAYYK
ncbi:toxin Cry1Ac domain D-VI-related protein, partial [Bacillus mycoides]